MVSSFKAVIRPFIPRPLYWAAHRAKRTLTIQRPLRPPLSFSPRASFEQAKHEAGIGYSDEAMLAKAHITYAWLTEMQDYAAPMLASVGLAAQSVGNRRLRILDFGGGRGSFYAYVNGFFGQHIQTDWTVVETASQVQHNNDLAVEHFRFSTEIGPEPYDLALFSGSLQYVDDWQSVLRETSAAMIYIARTAIGETERPYLQTVVRDEHVLHFPGRILDRSALVTLLSHSHELFAQWDFEAHLLEMGKFPAPAMLWRKR